MTHAKPVFQKLSTATIDQSPEIQSWLSQFSIGNRKAAKMLLHHLKFVSRDEFSVWLRRAVGELPDSEIYALYSVRKLEKTQVVFWDEAGNPVVRPGTSLGSEDLVYSLVSNLVRSGNGRLLDHPSLTDLKDQKVRNFVLIDDSIGSGDRISGFINAMLAHPTFLSWWSFGWVRLRIVSFARPREAEKRVIAKIRGSDHGKRKFRKSDKITFTSEVVYEIGWHEARWGKSHAEIINLCQAQTQIPTKRRLGYGDVMANIVFYHSVPNNIPGALWCTCKKWNGLMPERAIPDWLLNLLAAPLSVSNAANALPDELSKLLALVKRGIRSVRSLAIRLGVDHGYANDLIAYAKNLRLLTPQVRLTSVGMDRFIQSGKSLMLPEWDCSLYIPSSWCAGRVTVQPLTDGDSVSQRLADSVAASASADGDVGQTSLEGTDAKAATPPFGVTSHAPSASRERRDTDGPLGSKER
ncbi:phosphoribosyltransferase-like protein [Verminephrobacter eiseniae]|uniref:Uncharacterized protein n=1 Tax=Verminephrobacter eiseniae (strain EF01-2) TaxID=391735 RepID=A1WH45_VEREI|nr:hypothetical protein [Verminephrobacter eiseniae]ABM56952.1 hypothetical protein Veis_1180 [Verminephrobacter eiseniae EF01-2]